MIQAWWLQQSPVLRICIQMIRIQIHGDPHLEIADPDPNADPDPGESASKSFALTANLKVFYFFYFFFKKYIWPTAQQNSY